MRMGALLAAFMALAPLLAALPALAQTTDDIAFEVDVDRSVFYALSGAQAQIGFTMFNLEPAVGEFTVGCAGAGLAVTPPSQSFNISVGGRLEGVFNATAGGPGEFPFTVTMSKGNQSLKALATAVFLPLLSCRFVSPAANGRTGNVGVGQNYTGVVNFTNWDSSPARPSFALPSRDLAEKGGAESSQLVTLEVGEIAPAATRMFEYDGMSLPDLGTRDITPTVMVGGAQAMYGYEVGPAGVFNVTLFTFTLAARELLGIELSSDSFALGERARLTLYVESRRGSGIDGGVLDVSLRTDIEARNELSDYAAEPRFEEFVSTVKSKVDYDRHYGLPPMRPNVQQLLDFSFEPKSCRASGSGGSFFLDFRAELDGTTSRLSVPVSVTSPIALALTSHEAVSYARTGERLTRGITVRNLSNVTFSGATASFFLDFKEQGFVYKADMAETPAIAVPSLGPGEEAEITLSVTPRSPGTYALFPVVTWGDGLMVYGSHLSVVASAPQAVPIGPYVTAIIVIAVPVALMRRLAPG